MSNSSINAQGPLFINPEFTTSPAGGPAVQPLTPTQSPSNENIVQHQRPNPMSNPNNQPSIIINPHQMGPMPIMSSNMHNPFIPFPNNPGAFGRNMDPMSPMNRGAGMPVNFNKHMMNSYHNQNYPNMMPGFAGNSMNKAPNQMGVGGGGFIENPNLNMDIHQQQNLHGGTPKGQQISRQNSDLKSKAQELKDMMLRSNFCL